MGGTDGVPACPICGKPRLHRFRPFCSRRCADVDLGRWFAGSYVVAGDEAADASESGAEDPRASDRKE
jgi:hypothetical protein